MADYKQLVPFVKKWEGVGGDDPDDAGGFTRIGVTIATWKLYGVDNDHDGDIDEKDLSMITSSQWDAIFKYQFWNRVSGDLIKSQKVANILVDWVWNSGYH